MAVNDIFLPNSKLPMSSNVNKYIITPLHIRPLHAFLFNSNQSLVLSVSLISVIDAVFIGSQFLLAAVRVVR
jgi:hypothetical protein